MIVTKDGLKVLINKQVGARLTEVKAGMIDISKPPAPARTKSVGGVPHPGARPPKAKKPRKPKRPSRKADEAAKTEYKTALAKYKTEYAAYKVSPVLATYRKWYTKNKKYQKARKAARGAKTAGQAAAPAAAAKPAPAPVPAAKPAPAPKATAEPAPAAKAAAVKAARAGGYEGYGAEELGYSEEFYDMPEKGGEEEEKMLKRRKARKQREVLARAKSDEEALRAQTKGLSPTNNGPEWIKYVKALSTSHRNSLIGQIIGIIRDYKAAGWDPESTELPLNESLGHLYRQLLEYNPRGDYRMYTSKTRREKAKGKGKKLKKPADAPTTTAKPAAPKPAAKPGEKVHYDVKKYPGVKPAEDVTYVPTSDKKGVAAAMAAAMAKKPATAKAAPVAKAAPDPAATAASAAALGEHKAKAARLHADYRFEIAHLLRFNAIERLEGKDLMKAYRFSNQAYKQYKLGMSIGVPDQVKGKDKQLAIFDELRRKMRERASAGQEKSTEKRPSRIGQPPLKKLKKEDLQHQIKENERLLAWWRA